MFPLHMHKAEILCDEFLSSFFESLIVCRLRGHTLPMTSFHATFTSLSIHFACCEILAKLIGIFLESQH